MLKRNARNARRLRAGEGTQQNKVCDDYVSRRPSQFRCNVVGPSGSPHERLCLPGYALELCWYPAANQTFDRRQIVERM
jgi:hypothetical protein